jgi:periplasmic protein CpxP/Spy
MILKELTMKKVVVGVAAAALLITGTIFVFAQRSRSHEHGGFRHGGSAKAGMFLRGLDLTEEQRTKVREIFEAGKATVDPLRAQVRAGSEKLRELSKDGNFDEAQVEAIAAEQSGAMTKLIVEKERTKAQIFAILTDEQKAKAAEMHQNFERKFRSRGAKADRAAGAEF